MRFLIHASTEFEAGIVRERLAEAGIEAAFEMSAIGMMGMSAAGGDIYVEDDELARARRALYDAGEVSHEELEELSEELPPPL
ncbi:MAG: DUF2007 domain-containing protein [Solirubrobacterales bacterium]|nr:DUF2007 domain-containing protein [Solirubrobacterales bacterium]